LAAGTAAGQCAALADVDVERIEEAARAANRIRLEPWLLPPIRRARRRRLARHSRRDEQRNPQEHQAENEPSKDAATFLAGDYRAHDSRQEPNHENNNTGKYRVIRVTKLSLGRQE